jgi:Flp pilus assembly protein TadB
MASLLGAPLAIIVVFVLAVIGLLYWMRLMRQRQVQLRHEAVTGQVESLRYQVPAGQDPAAVMHALQMEGYEVVRDDGAMQTQDILVMCPAGADRERPRVRAVLAHADLNLEGDPPPENEVKFVDE